ncbi:TolC family protein [Acidicapsa acidisoli]|uniref:TolC family protein n=1 Tax=Acidicapsa acidisoli TaxID=1615681 RepID=UPI0021E0F397|nr:TolC family protein [Acidicapsa acidisoli]
MIASRLTRRRSWTALCIFIAVEAFAMPASGQDGRAISNCSAVINTKDAARCIGSVRPNIPIPAIDPKHIYTLPELIDIAEMASPEGRIAWTNAKRSLEQAGIDRALYLPILSFVAQGSDARFIVPFPAPIAPRGYVTVGEQIAAEQLELEYDLLDFGRGQKLDGSKALEIASVLRLGRVHQTLAYSTATEFYRAQRTIGELAAAKVILQTAETLLENAQLQYDHGRATLPDLQNAQAGAAEARFNLAAAEGEAKKSKLALSETIGVEPTTEIEIAPQSGRDLPGAFNDSVEDLIHNAWKMRPDLLARAQELRQAHDSYKIARAAYLPKASLSASGGQTNAWPSADWGQLGPASVATWSVEAKLRWEVFNGARKHEVAAALAEQKAAREEQRATEDSVTRQVWEAYVDYETAIEQQQSSQSFLTAAQMSYDSSLDAFKFGVRSLVDVVEAERQLAQARVTVVRSQAQLMQSAVALTYATGSLLQSGTTLPGAHP